MRILVCFGFLLAAYLLNTCTARPGKPPDPSSEFLVNENIVYLPLDEIFTPDYPQVPQEIVLDPDPLLKTRKTYLGYSLRDLIAPYLEDVDPADYGEVLLIYDCGDGYQPVQDLREALANEGYIVFKDLSAPPGQNWPDSLMGEYPPYYLVWKDLPTEFSAAPWPYGMEAIQINKSDTTFAPIRPSETALVPGFELFKKSCNKCHAIEGIGGDLGPDFQAPKSILADWEGEEIWHFLHNAPSPHHQTAANGGLSREEFDQIIRYLEYLRSRVSSELKE